MDFGAFYDQISEAMQKADDYYHDGLGWEISPIIFMDNRTLLCKYYFYDVPHKADSFVFELLNCCEHYFEMKGVYPNKLIISKKDLQEFGIEFQENDDSHFISISKIDDIGDDVSFMIDCKDKNETYSLEIEYGSLGNDWPIQLLYTELPREEEDSDLDFPDDEDNEDEFADDYDECEDQSDVPYEEDCEEYFANNPCDLSYYTFIRRYKNWVQEIKDYCEIFKKKYGMYPNILVMNRITHGRCEDAFEKYYRGSMDETEAYNKRVELGLEYNMDFEDDEECMYPEDVDECYFHTKDYKLRMMENSNFGSGVLQLIRVHGFLGNDEFPEQGTLPMGRDKEKSPHPVIDMKETGKNIEKIMKEEGVTPKIFARIMGWEKPQAIYRWYYGETLPTIDTLAVLSRILNRPIESILIMKSSAKAE